MRLKSRICDLLPTRGAIVWVGSPPDRSNPFIWIKFGVALEIPRSSELAYHVACANKQLVVGRAYLGYGDEVAMVVMDETSTKTSIARCRCPG